MKNVFKKSLAVMLSVILLLTMFSSVTFAWSTYTHNQIFYKSLEMLKHYFPEFETNPIVLEMMNYQNLINDATNDPDNFDKLSFWSADNDVIREFLGSGQLWSSHYMDPYTGLSYESYSPWHPNVKPHMSAGYYAKRYIDYAASEWRAGNKAYATYLLAYASHFISDATNPHHASLDISTEDASAMGLPDFDQDTSHGEHEDWANTHFDFLFDRYDLDVYDIGHTTGTPTEDRYTFETVLATSRNKNLGDFAFDRMLHYGRQVYGLGDDLVWFDNYISDLTPEQMTAEKGEDYVRLAYLGSVQVPVGGTYGGYQEYETKYRYMQEAELQDWIRSAVAGIDTATELFAEVLYRFIYEVENADLIKIEIDTDDAYYSASDDIFYFRFTDNQGKYKEIMLDNLYLQNGVLKDRDDFETGETNTFYMTVTNPSFIENISSFSIRHEEVFIDDAWKPRAIKIYRNNTLVHEQVINQWFENNNMRTYSLPNGLDYPTQPPMGNVNIQVLTGHGTHEWTDEGGTEDEVYFGIRTNTGLTHEIYLGNYFAENTVKSNIHIINNPAINWDNISSMYLRKINHDLPAGGTVDPEDAWFVEGVAIRADLDGDGYTEKTVYARDFGGRWIAESDNAIYEWNATVDTSKEYFGIMEAEVGVLDVEDAGADADVFLDIEFADGATTNYKLDTRADDFERNSLRSYYKVLPILKKDIRKLQLRLASGDELGLKSFMYKYYGLSGTQYTIYPKETFYDFIDTQNRTHDFLVPSAATGSGLGTFKVSIKTDEDSDANTDDEVYMSIEFNGKDMLMLPFATGSTNLARGQHLTKQFTVSNPNFKWEEVTKIVFRKRDTTWPGDDAWKIDSYTITKDGKNITGKSLHQWIGDSYEAFHNVPVYGGINVNNNIIGFMKVTVTVGNTADKSGTNDKLWLTIKANNDQWLSSHPLEKIGGFKKGTAEDVYIFNSMNMPWDISSITLSRDSGSSDEEFELQTLRVQFLEGDRGTFSQTFNEWITKTNTYARMDRNRNYSTIGSFTAYILTDHIDDADTDDDIYIGFEFDNGDRYEKYLDLSGDDFERDSFDAYGITIYNNDYNWSHLNKIYLVKRNGSNAWKVKALSIVAGGKTIYACNENKWINSNNTIFQSTGTALNPNANLIGFVRTEVKTKDGGIFDFYGTDDDIYMGLKVNGTWRYQQLDTQNNDFEEGDTNIFHVLYPYSVGTTNISMKKMAGGDDWYLEHVKLSFPGRSWSSYQYNFNKEYTSDNAQEFIMPVSSGSPF